MKLPLSLLKSFIIIDLSIEKIEETLTLLGIEVDAIHSPRPPFSHVVVAEIKKSTRHPNAEKLHVAEVFDGVHTIQVVCGASNCRTGLRVALAKVGAILTAASGEQRTIEKTSIRGVESHGMLCTASELGLYEDNSGLLELPTDLPLGGDCIALLWDPVFEISLTPNLGHCMSALGIARELSASLQKPLHLPKRHLHESNHSIKDLIEVSVQEATICPRYTARLIEGMKVAPSPFWLQKQLRAAGLNPINNVVDATNYLLLKNGTPLHAFDFNKIEGKTIEVSLSERPQPFHGLDGNQWTVPPSTILISDAKKVLALGGILGGASSAVSASTHTILLEAASFNSKTIRVSAKQMGLRTDSSQRFEKGVDPSTLPDFLDEAAELIAELSGGKIAKGRIDIGKHSFAPKRIACRPTRINQLLGTLLSESEIEKLFHRLGFQTRKEADKLQVDVPLYRFDLTEEIDLVEEAARLYGYNNIDRPLPRATSPQLPHDPSYLFETELRRRLAALGLQEVLNCDLISSKLATIAQELSHSKSVLLQTLHSKSEEYSILRPSLLPGVLHSIRLNLDQRNQNLPIFELGRIHFLQKEQPIEIPMMAIALTGKESPHHWDQKPSDADFYTLKGLVENLLQGLRISPFTFTSSEHPAFHPSRQANLFINSFCIGTIGEIHPQLLEKFDIKQRVYYAEINAQSLQSHQAPPPRMIPLPQFPSSERDWTIPLPPKTFLSTLTDAIRSASVPLLEKFELIDLFTKNDKHNATFRFTYRDLTKTISSAEVDAAHEHLTTQTLLYLSSR
jgi:phenylalanyl-tRNA synthetase beta chain